jgi:glycosyltransferase involved in cell wall biosynthesis
VRVLHVVPSFYPAICYGGPVYSVLNLCLNLSKLGCEMKVLTTDANGKCRLTAEQQQDPVLEFLEVHFCRRTGRGMVAPSMLRKLTAAARWADVIHLTAVYNFSTLPTLLAARLFNKPVVWSPRGTLQRWKYSRRVGAKSAWEGVCRTLSPRRMALHVTSEEEATESAQRLGNVCTSVIPNGIDIPPAPPPPPNDGVLKLLFVGRLDPKKGIENLISSVAKLRNFGVPNWRLRIVGDGDVSFVTRLHRMVSESGTAAPVEFCGHLAGKEKYRAYSTSDVVVIPSHTENFGLVVAEALAHARPVIASRGTPWAAVEQRDCGLWVNNDPSSLASAIQRITQRDRLAMGLRGREWMASSFSWRERAVSMLGLYEQLRAA